MSQLQSIVCTKCGSTNVINSEFCGKCGTSLTLVCRRCWASNPLNVAYCQKCGIELSKASLGLPLEVIRKWREKMFVQPSNHFGLMRDLSHRSGDILQKLTPPIGSQGESVAFCTEINPTMGILAIGINNSSSNELKLEPTNENDIAGSLVATNYRICIADYHRQKTLVYPYEDLEGMGLEGEDGKSPDEEPPVISLKFVSKINNSSARIRIMAPPMLLSEFDEKTGCLANVFAGMIGGDRAFHNQRNRTYIERREVDISNEQEAKMYMYELDTWIDFFVAIADAKGLK